ncbi:hypothetical protein BBW68_10045 [Candidatus Erwinia dacicola]|uniref:Uncharacterized protein n=1 Tax=Candidatus Erwinia dacicola TaxID=252393 RepID=A0A1E7Z0Q9_9GAMM|nr:hypothetical protein BBW68_10045 [Candidatus Erwinia dacicola]
MQFQWATTAGYRLCRVIITGIATGPRLIFIVPEMVSHFGIEDGFYTNFFQQPIELIEILWGFEIFGQFISQSLLHNLVYRLFSVTPFSYL